MSIKDIIAAANSGKAIPVIDLVRDQPEIPAIISKLQLSNDKANTYDSSGNKEITTTTPMDFMGISNDIARKSTDAESVNELFPDMELSAQILISSILSPKDMTNTEINFIVPPGLKISDISSSLIAELKNYCTKNYKIEPLLPIILRRMLFETGSYPVAVIPEASIDAIINNVSTENIKDSLSSLTSADGDTFKSIGILGPSDDNKSPTVIKHGGIRASLESIYTKGTSSLENYNGKVVGLKAFDGFLDNVSSNLSITDNYSVLKLPYVFERLKEQSVLNKIISASGKNTKVGLEAYSKMSDSTLTGLIYKNTKRHSANVIKVKTSNEVSRENIGEPLVMHLPSESVIPVYTPGNEEHHVGYFLLLDMEGNPINKSNNDSNYSDLQRRLGGQGNSMSSAMLDRAKSLYGNNCTTINVQQTAQIYADIVEADLLSRLRNGIYGKTLSIAGNQEVYRIMLARSFKAQFTQLLFIPAELMTYYAYKFDSRGIGKSLNDDLRVLNSIRAMMLFSKVAAQLKNSIGRTEVEVSLDPESPNPQGDIEKIIHQISSTRQQAFPLGISNAGDIADWIQKAGMQFNFTNHPGLPEMSVKFNETNTSYVEPNSDLEDDLRKRTIMAYGLSPETVDSGYSAEFATTIVANNILLNKRVIQIQDKFIPLITDNIRKVASNDGSLINRLKDIVKNNIAKVVPNLTDIKLDDDNTDVIVGLLVQEFLSNFETTLPRPDSITLDNQMAAYDTYVESLDKVLDNFVSTYTFPGSLVGEDLNQKIDEVKGVIKAAYMRRYMAENNIFSELFEMMTFDEKGEPLFNLEDIQKNYNNDFTKSVLKLFKTAAPIAAAANKDMGNLSVDDTVSSDASPTDTTSTDSGTGTTDTTDDGLGDSDFSLPDF